MKKEEEMIMARNIVANAFKHFNLINRHRWAVFKLCCKAGIPLYRPNPSACRKLYRYSDVYLRAVSA